MGNLGTASRSQSIEPGRDRPGVAPAASEPTVPADQAAPTTAARNRDFVRVGRSRIEGTGLFAKRRIHRGARIIEYAGERVETARLLVPVDGAQGSRIYTFRLNETIVIDGARGGNESRFINHSCEPDCEAYSFDDRMYIYAQVDIVRGQELTSTTSLLHHPGGAPRPAPTSMSAGAARPAAVERCGSPPGHAEHPPNQRGISHGQENQPQQPSCRVIGRGACRGPARELGIVRAGVTSEAGRSASLACKCAAQLEFRKTFRPCESGHGAQIEVGIQE